MYKVSEEKRQNEHRSEKKETVSLMKDYKREWREKIEERRTKEMTKERVKERSKE